LARAGVVRRVVMGSRVMLLIGGVQAQAKDEEGGGKPRSGRRYPGGRHLGQHGRGAATALGGVDGVRNVMTARRSIPKGTAEH
jgi:hypothetical protein